MNATMRAAPSAAGNSLEQAGDPFLFRRPQTWLLLICIILISVGDGAFLEQVSPGHRFARSPRATSESGGLYLLLTVITWVPCLILILRYFQPTVQTMWRQKAVLAFPVLALLSAIWSSTPEVTIRKAVLLFLACAFGWFIATDYTPSDQIRLLLVVGVILGLACIPMAILLPGFGLDFQGQWKGVFAQKNALGAMMFFLFSGLPFCRVPTLRKLLTLVLQALLPIGLIVMSQSKESVVCVAILIMVRLLGPFVATRRRDQIPFLLYATAFGMVGIVLGYNLLLALLNRDTTLSGRTHEWAVLIYYALKHFWLGYGYQAFWNGSPESLQAIHALRASIYGADSGYLDTMLQFGVTGLALWLILLHTSLGDIRRALRKPSLPLVGYWYSGLIIAIFVLNFVGSAALAPGGFIPFTLALSCAGMSNLAQKGREFE